MRWQAHVERNGPPTLECRVQGLSRSRVVERASDDHRQPVSIAARHLLHGERAHGVVVERGGGWPSAIGDASQLPLK